VRLVEWPRMPYLNEEVREWIGLELKNLGVEDLAVYAMEAGVDGDERRVIVATEVGLLDHRYAPYGSSARFRLGMLLYPWQTIRGVDLRADTFRLWAHEHRTRWSLKLAHPRFEAATESPDLGSALCHLARVCAVMAEPFGVPAGREALPPSPPSGRAAPRPPSDAKAESEPDKESDPKPDAKPESDADAKTAAKVKAGKGASSGDEPAGPSNGD
jgi:hypothetical protein